MRIVDIAQRSPAWTEWRRNGVCATDAPVLIGESPYKTRWRLWAEKRGLVEEPDLSANPNVKRGVELEPKAREVFENLHDDLLLPVCGQADEYPIIRASFDGFDKQGRPVEFKCSGEKVFNEVCRMGLEAPAVRLYIPQVQHQLYVSGADEGWLVFYYQAVTRELRIRRDETLIRRIVETSLAFWELVQTAQEPEKIPGRDYYNPQNWGPIEAEYRSLEDHKKVLEAELKQIAARQEALTQQMLNEMGEFRLAETERLRVLLYDQKGSVDYKAALSHFVPDLDPNALEAFRRKPQTRVKITLREPLREAA